MPDRIQGNMSLSPQARNSIFLWGLIGGGIIAGVEVIWYLSTFLWGILVWNYDFFSFIYSMEINSLVGELVFCTANICWPVLVAFPVFYWISKQPSRKTGLARTGITASLQAFAWWAIVKIILLGLFIPWHYTYFDFIIGMVGPFPFFVGFEVFGVYILAFLWMFGASRWMGTIGGRLGSSRSVSPAGHYSLSELPGSASDDPSGISPQAYQPQQPQMVSALELLQQRYARGEIDAATYQEMRAQLEIPARSHFNR